MTGYARWLFGTAALFNFAAGIGLLFLRGALTPFFHFDPAQGTNLVFLNFTGAMIALFGFGYARLAVDPPHFRPYISFSILGKSLAVLIVVSAWLGGGISWTLPALVSADVLFALLFFDFLRRTAA